jgi:hypothetical protein
MCLKEWKYQRKPLKSLFVTKRGRVAITKKGSFLSKRPRKEKTRALQKTLNVSQPVVERHHVDINDPQSSSQACYISEARTSKHTSDLVLGNHET